VACGTAAPARCRYCERPVCADHERPATHACTGPRTVPAESASAPDSGRTAVRVGGLLLLGTLVVAVLVIGAASLDPAQTSGGERLDESRLATLVHERVDAERRERGVGGVAWNESLAGVARAHSADMAEHGYVGHERDGPLFERYAAAGLSCPGGENVYAVSTVGVGADAERALARRTVDAWLDSPGHRETLLKERFTQHGVGDVVASERGRATVYVTEEFC